jgi:hypothetical protein
VRLQCIEAASSRVLLHATEKMPGRSEGAAGKKPCRGTHWFAEVMAVAHVCVPHAPACLRKTKSWFSASIWRRTFLAVTDSVLTGQLDEASGMLAFIPDPSPRPSGV